MLLNKILTSTLAVFAISYCNIATARYLNSDPIGLAGGTNTYSYVENNPVNKIDPEGKEVVLPGPGAWIGGGATEGGLSAYCLANPAVCGVIGAGGIGLGIGSLIYPHIAVPVGDMIDKMCRDDKEPCDLVFVREMRSYDGKTKSCLYRRKGTIFTFPQAVGYACPPINLETCMVDTSFIMPPARY